MKSLLVYYPFILELILLYVSSNNIKKGRLYLKEEENVEHKRFLWSKRENKFIDLKSDITNTATISDVTFFLYTKYTLNEPFIINSPHIWNVLNKSDSPFNKKKKNVFICHGWNNDYSSPVNREIVPAILTHYDVNVFVVDWSPIAKRNYFTARMAVTDIGDYVSNFINLMLDNYNITSEKFLLIGHSLGAHIMGITGAGMKMKPYEIVGLDPAAPFFSLNNTDDRLDETDAKYVQVIHTSSKYLAFYSAIGKADFYPNGGFDQPGCGKLDSILGICSHSRSYQYYAESILRGAVFRSTICSGYDDYQLNLCTNESIAFMGMLFIDKKASGDYYLNTNSHSPFAKPQLEN